jgi:hypothetical protein
MRGSKYLTYFSITLFRHIPFGVSPLLFRNHPTFHIVHNLLPIKRLIVYAEISVTTVTYIYIYILIWSIPYSGNEEFGPPGIVSVPYQNSAGILSICFFFFKLVG